MSKSYTKNFFMSNPQNENIDECLESFRKRFRNWIMDEFGTYAAYENGCKIKNNTAGKWFSHSKSGKPSLPGIQFIIKTATCKDVSLNWLLLGLGSQKLADCRTDEGGKSATGSTMDPELQQRIDKLEAQNDRLFNQNDRLSQENERLAQRIQFLEQKLEDLGMELKKSEDETESLRSRLGS